MIGARNKLFRSGPSGAGRGDRGPDRRTQSTVFKLSRHFRRSTRRRNVSHGHARARTDRNALTLGCHPTSAGLLRPSGRQDLNLRPLDPQSSALPSCATSRPRPRGARAQPSAAMRAPANLAYLARHPRLQRKLSESGDRRGSTLTRDDVRGRGLRRPGRALRRVSRRAAGATPRRWACPPAADPRRGTWARR